MKMTANASASAVAQALGLAIACRVPVMLWGPPGTGKSSLVYAAAEALGLPCEVVLASLRDPTDFLGLPVPSDRGTVYEAPAWARRLAAAPGVLFLDEISAAPRAVQVAAYRVVLERVVGELPLHPDTAVVAAGNRPEEGGEGELAPPLANRLPQLVWTGLPFDEWAVGMTSGKWAPPPIPRLPADWSAAEREAHASVAAFLRTRPHLRHQLPKPESGQQGYAWPSDRTWDIGARLLGAAMAVGASDDVRLTVLAAAVGEGAALEFLAWQRDMDLPKPEEVLADPEGFPLPERADRLYAILTAVAAHAAAGPDELIGRAWTVAFRAAKTSIDVAYVAARVLARESMQRKLPAPEDIDTFLPVLEEVNK